VFVLFTSTKATLTALEQADELARSRGSSIVLVAAQMIPFPSPIDKPLVSKDFLVDRLHEIAGQVRDDIMTFACLCRDPLEVLTQFPSIRFPIFLGTRKSLWPNRDKRPARKLKQAGFAVILVETV
jgi:hypothetical protein